MKVNFKDNRIVEIDDARLVFRNFAGRGDRFNREGDRNFAVVIPNEEIKDALVNDTNEYGIGWNVKIKPPREAGDDPFMYLKVKVAFNGRGPAVYLKSGDSMVRMSEEIIDRLDDIDIESVDLDIRPYDSEMNGRPFRAAYLQSMCVTQRVDRFARRYEDESTPF